MQVVLDTNVLVSGLISAKATPARIIDLLRAGKLSLVVDDRIFAEYFDVLRRPQLQRYFDQSAVAHILDYVRSSSEKVIVVRFITGLPDRQDAPFLEVACQAEVPLITGNARHFPAESRCGARISSPAEFISSAEWL